MSAIEERRPLLGQPGNEDINASGQVSWWSGTHGQEGLERGGSEARLSETLSWKEWTAEKLEASSTHKAIIVLIAIDACCVLADLVYTFLSPERDCSNPHLNLASNPAPFADPQLGTGTFISNDEGSNPIWLTILSHISLSITTLFLLEIPLALWCFGLSFYNPFPSLFGNRKREGVEDGSEGGDGVGSEGGYPYAGLHLFDALVVITTFILEVVLRGREAEVAGLLILLRLWRLVKLIGGLAVGAGELQEELSNKLAETEHLLLQERARARQLEEENADLRSRINLKGPVVDTDIQEVI